MLNIRTNSLACENWLDLVKSYAHQTHKIYQVLAFVDFKAPGSLKSTE